MTAIKVVDASAVAALVLDEPEGGRVADRLRGALLKAPALLDFELANVCRTRCRREPDLRERFLAAFRLRRRLNIEEAPVDHDAVVELSIATGLTAYDASYLWLSRHLGAELVTLDRQLMAEAARSS